MLKLNHGIILEPEGLFLSVMTKSWAAWAGRPWKSFRIWRDWRKVWHGRQSAFITWQNLPVLGAQVTSGYRWDVVAFLTFKTHRKYIFFRSVSSEWSFLYSELFFQLHTEWTLFIHYSCVLSLIVNDDIIWTACTKTIWILIPMF